MSNHTYGQLPTVVSHDNRVSDFQCRLYTEISSLSNKYGYCFASNEYLGKTFSKSPETISRAISGLQKLEYLTVIIEDGYKRKMKVKMDFSDMEPVDENVKGGSQKDQGGLTKMSRGVDENVMTANNIIQLDKSNEINRRIVETSSTAFLDQDEIEEIEQQIYHSKTTEKKEKKSVARKRKETTAEEMDLVFQVVAYLNEKTEQAFQSGGEKTKSLILARHHADKWGLEDFKTVIDHKKSEWFAKDNLRQYLRPSTLFAAGHAEEYLQAAKLWKKKPVATSPGVVPLFRQSDYTNIDKSKFKF